MARLKYDKEARYEFMVLSTRLKDERMIGHEEGREEGRQKKSREVVINMLKKGYEIEAIADVVQISVEEVKQIAEEAER